MVNDENRQETVDAINAHLPDAIRVNEIKRVTKGFNCKNDCDARTYKYLMPTYALCRVMEMPKPPMASDPEPSPEEQAEIDKVIKEAYNKHEEYRITDDKISRMNNLLGKFIGSRYYHNFTSGKLPLEPSSQRFITKFSIVDKFIMTHEGHDLEMALIEVKGQSFMLHQIRKMIGLAIAVSRDHCPEDKIEESWGTLRVDVPRAPGLGLMLDEIHYENYNKRFAKTHEKLEWSASSESVERFMRDNVYSDIVRSEILNKSMLEWLRTLYVHSFAARHFEHEIPKDETPEQHKKRMELIQVKILEKRKASEIKDDQSNGKTKEEDVKKLKTS